MAAAVGLPLLAVLVTALHFVIMIGYTRLSQLLPNSTSSRARLHVTYRDSEGVLRRLLSECTHSAWSVTSLSVDSPGRDGGIGVLVEGGTNAGIPEVGVSLDLRGANVARAAVVLGAVDGATAIDLVDEDAE